MQDLMFANEPLEERAQLLRDNCDQIVERSYTRTFSQDEINGRRAELAQVSIQVQELDEQLAQVRADIKGRIKPLLERRGRILDELKARGEWVQGESYKFVDHEEGKTAFYSPEGYKIEERAITPEERQRSVMQSARAFSPFRVTGTDD